MFNQKLIPPSGVLGGASFPSGKVRRLFVFPVAEETRMARKRTRPVFVGLRLTEAEGATLTALRERLEAPSLSDAVRHSLSATATALRIVRPEPPTPPRKQAA
jgi:hypothetical protein